MPAGLIAVALAAALLAGAPASAAAYDWTQTTKTNPVPATLEPGQKTTVVVVLKNVGTQTWFSDAAAQDGHPVRLATVAPRDRRSVFASSDPAWTADGTRVRMLTPVVPANAYGTFAITLTAPSLASYPQTFEEHFAPVAEDLAWMDSHDLAVTVTVAHALPDAPGDRCPASSPALEGPEAPSYSDVTPPVLALGYGAGTPRTPSGAANQLAGPRAVALDTRGDLVVTDTGHDRVLRIDKTSGFVLASFGGTGTTAGKMRAPAGVAVTPSGLSVYVADTGNDRIQVFGVAGLYFGGFGSTGSGPGQFLAPQGLAFVTDGAMAGDLVVADTGNNRIQILTASGDPVAAFGEAGNLPGQLLAPSAVAVYGKHIFVADTGNSRIQRFTLDGGFAGMWGGAGEGDGCTGAPTGIAAGALGVYVADSGHDRLQHFTRNGLQLEQWGATGAGAGSVRAPSGLAVTSDGTVWAAEEAGNRLQSFAPTISVVKNVPCGSDPPACLPRT